MILGPRRAHRTRRVVRAAGDARFRRRHPSGTDARLSRGKREGQEDGGHTAAEAQHSSRMREWLCPVKSGVRDNSPVEDTAKIAPGYSVLKTTMGSELAARRAGR